MKLVKIAITGSTNRYTEQRPNSLLFIDMNEDLTGATLWMVDNRYTREDAELYFDSVEYLETKEL